MRISFIDQNGLVTFQIGRTQLCTPQSQPFRRPFFCHRTKCNVVPNVTARPTISSITLPYIFFNVSSYYNNKTFSLIFPTAATTITYSFTLPDGFYTVTDINSYIQQQCIANGAYLIDSSSNNVYFVQLVYNSTYYAVQFLYFSVPTTIGTYTRPTTGLYSLTGTGLPTTAYTPQLVLASFGSIKILLVLLLGLFHQFKR